MRSFASVMPRTQNHGQAHAVQRIILNIRIHIPPRRLPQRIGAQEPPQPRIVVPVLRMVQPRLRIILIPRKPELRPRQLRIARALPERRIAERAHQRPVRAGRHHRAQSIEMIVDHAHDRVVPVHRPGRRHHHHRSRRRAQIPIEPQHVPRAVVVRDHPAFRIVVIHGGHPVHRLRISPPERVVAIARHQPGRRRGQDMPVALGIIGVGAGAVIGQVAIRIKRERRPAGDARARRCPSRSPPGATHGAIPVGPKDI